MERTEAWIAALALSLLAALVLCGPAAAAKAKKKQKGSSVVEIVRSDNVAVPEATVAQNGFLPQTAALSGKKLRRMRIRDVNVTISTVGSGDGAAADFQAILTAPNGATTWLLGGVPGGAGFLSGQSIGPLTLDDESQNRLGNTPPPPPNSNTLLTPYVGNAQPNCFFSPGSCTLSVMDGGLVSGTWTLWVFDTDPTVGLTNVLKAWTVTIRYGKPFQLRS